MKALLIQKPLSQFRVIDHFLLYKFRWQELANSPNELLQSYLFVIVQETWIYNPEMKLSALSCMLLIR